MEYLWVKHLHMTSVVISVSLFLLRGTLELLSRPWRQWRLLRVAPHVIDTVLLGSALWLAWRIGQYPFVDGWLTAGALLTVGYIVGVALTHSSSWGLIQ